MERFSLANFLQTLMKLPLPESENPPPEQPQTEQAEQTIPTPSTSTDAILTFMDEHEKRARRIKR